jgi:hypothetical protein
MHGSVYRLDGRELEHPSTEDLWWTMGINSESLQSWTTSFNVVFCLKVKPCSIHLARQTRSHSQAYRRAHITCSFGRVYFGSPANGKRIFRRIVVSSRAWLVPGGDSNVKPFCCPHSSSESYNSTGFISNAPGCFPDFVSASHKAPAAGIDAAINASGP